MGEYVGGGLRESREVWVGVPARRTSVGARLNADEHGDGLNEARVRRARRGLSGEKGEARARERNTVLGDSVLANSEVTEPKLRVTGNHRLITIIKLTFRKAYLQDRYVFLCSRNFRL